MVPWGYIPPNNLDGTDTGDPYESGSITRQLSREERFAAAAVDTSSLLLSASEASIRQGKKKKQRRPRSSPAKAGRSGRGGRGVGAYRSGSSARQQLRELMACSASGNGGSTAASGGGARTSSPKKKRRPRKKAPAPDDGGWGELEPGPEAQPTENAGPKYTVEKSALGADETLNETIAGGQSFADGAEMSLAAPPASPGDVAVSESSLGLDMAAVHAANEIGRDQGWYHDADDELPALDSLDSKTWKSYSGRLRSTSSSTAPKPQEPARTSTQSVAFSPHLKTWSIARPFSAPPERAAGLDEHVRSPAARRERQAELTQLGVHFCNGMQSDRPRVGGISWG